MGAVAALGAWLTMLSNGIRPKEVMDALGGLFSKAPAQEVTASPPTAEPPRILFQEPRIRTVRSKSQARSGATRIGAGWAGII